MINSPAGAGTDGGGGVSGGDGALRPLPAIVAGLERLDPGCALVSPFASALCVVLQVCSGRSSSVP